MGTIGGWWVASLDANPDEAVRATFYANQLRRSQRPLGGKLYVTNQRLVFCPHLIDGMLGGKPVAYDLADVEVADRVIPPDGDPDPFGGGREERLGIELTDGRDANFVLDDLEEAISAILGAIGEDARARS